MDSPRELTLADLPEIDALRESIGWGRGGWFLDAMMQSGGCVLGIRDDRGALVAMGGAALLGPAGFICNMVVAPGQKRRGFGRAIFEALLAWLRKRGAEAIQLEATEEGQPLYEQYGFRVRWESVTSSMIQPVERGDETGIAPLLDEDWPEFGRLLRTAYGDDRAELHRTLARGPHLLEAAKLVEGGRLVAAGFCYPGRLGPLVAATSWAGEKLARALAARSPADTFATVGHPMHAALWERLGFEVGPFDVRMCVGPEPDDRPEMVISMLNGGIG